MTIGEQILTALIPVFVAIGWGVAKLMKAWESRIAAKTITEADAAKVKAAADAEAVKLKAASDAKRADAEAGATTLEAQAEAEAIRAKAAIDVAHANEMQALRRDVDANKLAHINCETRLTNALGRISVLEAKNGITPAEPMEAVRPP